MAQMCVSGKRALYQYRREHGIPHRNCGKLIVATTSSETEKLQLIRAHAEANGVDDLQLLTGEAARALEPALNCDAACSRRPPASSTVTPTCWRCGATRRKAARLTHFIRHSCAPRPMPAGSKSKPAATRR